MSARASKSARLLTADLGNSCCKLRLWEPLGATAESVRGVSFPAGVTLADEVARWLREDAAPAHAALSAVGDRALEQQLRSELAAAVTGQVLTPEHGLELDVYEPHTVGVDRLFAARGALDHVGESALVLDAGTALTVDAVDLVERTLGVFRGGAIAPGPQSLADALADRGARLPRVTPRAGVRALGKSTSEALVAGAVVGFRGAARELVRAVGEESGLGDAPLVLTGGARGFLLEPPLFAGRRLVVVEDLVLLGLLAALLGHLGEPGRARSQP